MIVVTSIMPCNQHQKNDDDEYYKITTKGSVSENFELTHVQFLEKKSTTLKCFGSLVKREGMNHLQVSLFLSCAIKSGDKKKTH